MRSSITWAHRGLHLSICKSHVVVKNTFFCWCSFVNKYLNTFIMAYTDVSDRRHFVKVKLATNSPEHAKHNNYCPRVRGGCSYDQVTLATRSVAKFVFCDQMHRWRHARPWGKQGQKTHIFWIQFCCIWTRLQSEVMWISQVVLLMSETVWI